MRLKEDSDFKRITGNVAPRKRQEIVNGFNKAGSAYKVPATHGICACWLVIDTQGYLV